MAFLTGKRNRIHGDEPLLGSPENHRVVAAPAMRVAMLVRVVAKQCAAIGKQFYDNRVCCEDVLAFVFRQPFRVNAFVIKRRINFETISLAGVEVIGTVAGCGVNDAAALIEGDVIGEQTEHLNWQKWMLEQHPFKVAAFIRRENFGLLDFAFGLQSRNAIR